MQIPKWTKPALWGAGAGAIALAVVGFNWGGWVTSSAAAQMANKQEVAAIAAVLTPYCVENSKTDPKSAEVFVEFKKGNSYQQRQIIEKAGWATPLGSDKPNSVLASACQAELSKDI